MDRFSDMIHEHETEIKERDESIDKLKDDILVRDIWIKEYQEELHKLQKELDNA